MVHRASSFDAGLSGCLGTSGSAQNIWLGQNGQAFLAPIAFEEQLFGGIYLSLIHVAEVAEEEQHGTAIWVQQIHFPGVSSTTLNTD